jgi:lysophospholipase L1-like esterase
LEEIVYKARWLAVLALVIPLGLVGPGSASGASAAVPCRIPAETAGAGAGAGAQLAAAPTVWMAGDSTMANPGSTCPVGWGSQFGALFQSGVTVNNRAVSGRSIQTWLYEGNVTSTMDSTGECALSSTAYSTRWTEMLNGMTSGDYLIIQFGINDGDTTCPRHVGSAKYQQYLKMMAQAAIDRGAHPILLTAVAAITCSGSTAVKNRGFVTETTAAATATGSPLIDLQTLSINLYNSLKFCPNDSDYTSGTVGAFFCNDHTHFETYGAQQIAALVAGALRTQNIPLASYLA